MLRGALISLLFVGSGAPALAETSQIDTEGFKALAPFVKDWETQDVTLDADTLSQIKASFAAELPEAFERFEAIVTAPNTQARIQVVFADTSPIRVAWLSINKVPKTTRVFVNMAHQNSDLFLDQYAPNMMTWLQNASGTTLQSNLSQSVFNAWTEYASPSRDHPWISLGEIEGRVMAWGVPPEFFELVIADESCAFLPSRAWFLRQIC